MEIRYLTIISCLGPTHIQQVSPSLDKSFFRIRPPRVLKSKLFRECLYVERIFPVLWTTTKDINMADMFVMNGFGLTTCSWL